MLDNVMAPRRITRDANHVYTFDGKQYPSVTTVLDVLGATFSVAANYGAKHAALAALDLAPELVKMIETVGREGAAKAIASAGNNYRDKASQLGTDVHGLADQLIRGETLPPMPVETRRRVEHVAEWWQRSGWTARASEAMLVNPEMQYGGTLDLLAYDADGKTVLLDYKTGRGVYKEAVLQLTGYAGATYLESEKGFFSMPAVDRFVILHVTETDARQIEINIGPMERLAWAAVRDVYDWAETMKGKRL